MLKNNYHVSSEKVSDCKDYRDFEDNYEPFGYNYIHWEEKVPRFEGKYLFDEKITTTWKPEKPLNEWINMVFPKKEIKKIQIFAGNGQSDELYYDNNRVKEMRLEFSNGKSFNVKLADKKEMQGISIEPIETEFIRFVIIDIYKGNKYNDTCISELKIE